jgi:hypothetical protein
MNGLSRQDILNRFIWIRGLPPIDFWIRREAMIGEFIKKNKLRPMDTSAFEFEALSEVAKATTERAALPLRRPPFPGGMRIPHLHFNANVYALDETQWRAFSGGVMADLKEKLAKASALSFDQLRDVAGEVDRLA